MVTEDKNKKPKKQSKKTEQVKQVKQIKKSPGIIPAKGLKAKTTEPQKLKNKKRILWFIIPIVAAIIVIASITGAYFYFSYYLKSNFEDSSFNKVISSASGKVSPGQEITYTIEYKNTGNTTAEDLIIKTSIPQNTEFVSAAPSAFYDDKAAASVTFNTGELLKDEAGSVDFTVRVISPCDNGTIIKSGEVFFEYTARKSKNSFKISQSLENTVVSSPDFSVLTATVKDLNGGNINIGDLVEFDILIKNSGDMDAKDVKLLDSFSPKLLLDEKSLAPGAILDKGNNQITFSISELKAGELRSFSFKASIGQDFGDLEVFKNTVLVNYAGKTENEAFVEKQVHGFPNFDQSFYTVADTDGGSVWAGDILEYKIVLKNSGIAPGQNFKLFCPVPQGTSPVLDSIKASEGAQYDKDNNTVVYDIKELTAGGELSVNFMVKISSSMIRGGRIDSAFHIEGDEQYVEMEPASISVRSYVFTTIVCMGDSEIVFTNWPAILDYLLESRYPHAEFTVIGSGVPQEMAYQGVRRFDSTVAIYGPQIVVFGYGTNDTGNPGGTAILWNGTNDLINKARAIGATPIVHSIGWIDTGKHVLKKGVNSYNSALRDVSAANGVPYVDIFSLMASDPGKYVSGDGLHWTSDGGGLVATLVFNTLINYLDGEGARK